MSVICRSVKSRNVTHSSSSLKVEVMCVPKWTTEPELKTRHWWLRTSMRWKVVFFHVTFAVWVTNVQLCNVTYLEKLFFQKYRHLVHYFRLQWSHFVIFCCTTSLGLSHLCLYVCTTAPRVCHRCISVLCLSPNS